MNTGESCGTKDVSDGESGDGEYGEEFDSQWRTRATMNLFSTIWMRRVTLHRQFSSYQMTKYVKNPKIIIILVCVASVSNRVIARKLERERPNFSRRTRAETLATQAIIISEN